MRSTHRLFFQKDFPDKYIEEENKPHIDMLVDRTNNKTYSCRSEAIRLLGEKEFVKKAKKNDFYYVQCRLA